MNERSRESRAAEPGRMPALDGLRGLAILAVLLHTFSPLQGHEFPIKEFKLVLDLGWIGVQLFFVLSGFLITGILLDSQGTPGYLGNFLVRRALRIFPLYYGVLAIAFLVLPAVSPAVARWRIEFGNEVWLWAYLSNWVQYDWSHTRPFAHFWSLCVEEQFYLLWPLLLWRMRPARVLQTCAVLMLAAPLFRAVMIWRGFNPEAVYMLTVCRMDALAAGAAVAACLRLPGGSPRCLGRMAGVRWAAWGALGAVAVPSHVYERLHPLTQVAAYSLFALAFAVLVLDSVRNHAAGSVWHRPLQTPVLVNVGRYSYAMYIFGPLLEKSIGPQILAGGFAGASQRLIPGLGYCLFMTLLSYVCGWLSFHLYERHFLALKARFVPPASVHSLLRSG
jgi:peptidoglycan/LPS O-acetylase OafA/YrhL